MPALRALLISSGLARDDGGDAAAKGIESAQKRQQQSKRSKQIQRLPPKSSDETLATR